jgi:acyl-CoA synthetase (AMP-forming)/AMP-acid ligase II/thioesterase domain-containing protein/acyl carrier protein
MLYHLIEKQVENNPDGDAIGGPNRQILHYQELQTHIDKTVSRLNQLGIGRNDAVAIVLPNGPEMASAFVSIACGATCAPLNPAYRAPEFEFYLTDLNAKALVIHDELDSAARGTAKSKGIPILELSVDSHSPAGLFELNGNPQPLTSESGFADIDDIALVLHTSGTTSRPKIVPLRHGNVIASARNIANTLQLSQSDRCLNVMPLFHIHGLMAAVLASLWAGANVICTPGYYATEFYGWLNTHKPSWYTAVPTMHQSILARAPQNTDVIKGIDLRFVRSSSSSLPPQVMHQLEETFDAPVVEAYGMTEASHQMACNPITQGAQKPGSVGPPAGPEVEIMDENGPDLLPQGHLGEIVIRGENVFSGYANNPEANEAAFTKGWFRTGDQGYKDSDGYIFLTGRLKEIINRGGEKISPREVDEILLNHPKITQALTFAMPDAALGEEIAAAVIVNDEGLTERDIRHYSAEHLADFKVPRRVIILDEIPKGPTGKLQRIGLAEKLGLTAEEPQEVHREFIAPRSPAEKVLAEIWKEQLGLQQIGIRDKFIEMGGDSMLAARLVQRVSKEFGVRITLTDFSDTPTIEDQAEYLQNLSIQVESNFGKKPNLITALNTGGKKSRLFYMSASTQDTYIFSGLSRGLGKDQPLFGLTPYNLPVEEKNDPVEYLAGEYIKEIKKIQPKGPYILGGNCSGGTVAFEVARQLIDMGENVDYLIMTEAYGMNYPNLKGSKRIFEGLYHYYYQLRKHIDSLQVLPKADRRFYFSDLVQRQVRRIGKLIRMIFGKKSKRDPETIFPYHFRPGKNYHPKPVSCHVHLLRAENQPFGIEEDKTLGWSNLVDGMISVIDVPGYHGNTYHGARAENIGKRINTLLGEKN